MTDKPDIDDLRLEESGVKRDVVYSHIDEELILRYLKERYEETKSLTDLEYYHYIKVQFKLGLRPSEFFSLKLGDIDFKNNTLTISKGSNKGMTKNKVVRTLPIGGTTIDSLNILARKSIEKIFPEFRAEELPDKGEDFAEEREERRGIIDTSRLPITIRNLQLTGLTKDKCSRRWLKLKSRMGWYGVKKYEDYVQYAIRHTVATRLASELSFGAHQIMKFMGHKNIATSLQYIHLNVEDIRNAVNIGKGA